MRVPLAAGIVCAGLFVLSAYSSRAGEVSGPFANRLSPEDVKQIKAAVSKNMHIPHSVKKIEAVAADKVHVQSGGRIAIDQDKYYDFNVYRHAGGWAIDLDSIQISIEQRDLRTNGPAIIR